MLLSLSHKYIFVANVKSASTSIESTLRTTAEIRIVETRFGKHMTLGQIAQRFDWTTKYVRAEDFFVFGVVREPVDLLLSLYNAHTGESLRDKPNPTTGMSFDQFLEVWLADNFQGKSQARRFRDRSGLLRMTHLIDYDSLSEEFAKVCERLGLGGKRLKHLNISSDTLRRSDLTPAQIARVEDMYAQDYELLRKRPRAF
ncbi:MAG TPA: sulfotransferase family 2 domain-containing protein [Rhizomicrobium sp.]|nr:sulfotransferase family 2 domain-containing protein [Rhizomicrobium sp.]